MYFAACIGPWGIDCVNRCTDGFYGHGCRLKCQCSEQLQICDSKQGCTNRNGTDGILCTYTSETYIDRFSNVFVKISLTSHFYYN